MNTTSALMGVLPLLVFVIVDSLGGLKSGLIAAVVIAFVEAGASYYYLGELDHITLISFALVLGMAGVSFWSNSSLALKMQPVALGVFLSLTLLISYFWGHPLLLEMSMKYKEHMPMEMQARFNNPLMGEILRYSSLYLGFTLLAHAALTAYAALRLSNWWWLVIRGIGVYVFIFLGSIMAILHIRFLTPNII